MPLLRASPAPQPPPLSQPLCPIPRLPQTLAPPVLQLLPATQLVRVRLRMPQFHPRLPLTGPRVMASRARGPAATHYRALVAAPQLL